MNIRRFIIELFLGILILLIINWEFDLIIVLIINFIFSVKEFSKLKIYYKSKIHNGELIYSIFNLVFIYKCKNNYYLSMSDKSFQIKSLENIILINRQDTSSYLLSEFNTLYWFAIIDSIIYLILK